MKKMLPLLLPLLSLLLIAGATKQPQGSGTVTVRFYAEGIAGDINTNPDPIILADQRKIYRSKVASLSERDIAGIWAFQTDDGSIGCVFVMNDEGRAKLYRLSVEKFRSTITAEVGGRLIINLKIDQPIPDGELVIPHGMTTKEGFALRRSFKTVQPPKPLPTATPNKEAQMPY
jgi:hypothetical protein